MPWLPLNAREKRALAVWGVILSALGVFDASQHGASTLTEANRCIRRRVGLRRWTVGWSLFAVWFWDHIRREHP